MNKTKIEVVIGAQFGDEGKGRTVADIINRELDLGVTPKELLNVRFNGGAQASHTVIHNGIRHAHSHYGSGTLQNVQTYLTDKFIVNTMVLNRETRELSEKGVTPPRVLISNRAKITTPYEMFANQLIELINAKKDRHHGSCGLGIHETEWAYELDRQYRQSMYDHLIHAITYLQNSSGDKLHTYDDRVNEMYGLLDQFFNFKDVTKSAIWQIFIKRVVSQTDVDEDYILKHGCELLSDGHFVDLPGFVTSTLYVWIREFGSLNLKFVDDAFLKQTIMSRKYQTIIFEGAQGLMLDAVYGSFPHVTCSRTDLTNVQSALESVWNHVSVSVNYVTRCYSTRHGKGPFSNSLTLDEMQMYGFDIVDETNVSNTFQESMRFALLKHYELVRIIKMSFYPHNINEFITRATSPINYGLFKERIFDKIRLVITCADQFSGKEFPYDCSSNYDASNIKVAESIESYGKNVLRKELCEGLDLNILNISNDDVEVIVLSQPHVGSKF